MRTLDTHLAGITADQPHPESYRSDLPLQSVHTDQFAQGFEAGHSEGYDEGYDDGERDAEAKAKRRASTTQASA